MILLDLPASPNMRAKHVWVSLLLWSDQKKFQNKILQFDVNCCWKCSTGGGTRIFNFSKSFLKIMFYTSRRGSANKVRILRPSQKWIKRESYWLSSQFCKIFNLVSEMLQILSGWLHCKSSAPARGSRNFLFFFKCRLKNMFYTSRRGSANKVRILRPSQKWIKRESHWLSSQFCKIFNLVSEMLQILSGWLHCKSSAPARGSRIFFFFLNAA